MFQKLFKTSAMVDFIIREETKANGHCRLTSSPIIEDFKSVVLQLGFPFGGPYLSIFDELISWAFIYNLTLSLREVN